MAFITANTGEQIKAKFDGALRNTFANSRDYIVEDIGDEFECTYTSTSLDVQVGTGMAIIGGRGIEANEDNSITLTANSTIYLCLRIDLTQLQGQVGMLYANTSSVIQQGNLNNDNSAIRDMLIATITTNTNGIVSVEDKRTIRSKAGGVEYTTQETSGDDKFITLTEDGYNLYPKAQAFGIDKNNLLVSGSTNWTATQDCYILTGFSRNTGENMYLWIDGVAVIYFMNHGVEGANDGYNGFAFAKKGQVITSTNGFTAYGIMR